MTSVLVHLKILRPVQWIKNLILFFPPYLGGMLGTLATAGPVVWLAPLAFCLVSSSAYVLNDLLDAQSDREHPQKSQRPLASGRIRRSTATGIGVLALAGGLCAGALVSVIFVLILLGYCAIAIGYSLKFKHVPVVDLFCISAGFLLRLQSGGVAFGVPISDWLFLSVFFLSLFLSAGKRFAEKRLLGADGERHRATLVRYPHGFLEGTMVLSGAAVLVTYTMYVTSHRSLVYSVPLCCFGLLRYLFRLKSGQSGDPTESLLRDGPLLAVGLLWTVIIGWSIYF